MQTASCSPATTFPEQGREQASPPKARRRIQQDERVKTFAELDRLGPQIRDRIGAQAFGRVIDRVVSR
jgi:hypothetical protein